MWFFFTAYQSAIATFLCLIRWSPVAQLAITTQAAAVWIVRLYYKFATLVRKRIFFPFPFFANFLRRNILIVHDTEQWKKCIYFFQLSCTPHITVFSNFGGGGGSYKNINYINLCVQLFFIFAYHYIVLGN